MDLSQKKATISGLEHYLLLGISLQEILPSNLSNWIQKIMTL
jgi:hypothetical protein